MNAWKENSQDKERDAIHGLDNKEVPQREKTAGSLRDACLCMLGEWPVGV